MKRIAAVVVTLLALGRAFSAEETTTNEPIRLTAVEAKNHIGTNAIVTGTVVEVYKGGRTVNLNFDNPFPKQPFSAVIFAEKTNLFPEVDKLKGKSVECTGKITEYRDRPQIVIAKTNQLKVIEKEAK